ncbi:XAC2610-related protein [Chryseobacterium sp. SIMBA_038]|uniref:XAC2610-related protein n=2 Tax=Pseudomonadati TaxID=3379134 RepID=UPI0039795F43
MKNILSFSIIALTIIACSKEKLDFNENKINKNSVELIKDSTLFVNSSEGEEVKFSINKMTKDSIIESEIFGETGKLIYKFTFNKELKTGECTTLKYEEPIYVNPNPKIKSQIKENLLTSPQTKDGLQKIFKNYSKILFNKKISSQNLNYSFSISILEKDTDNKPTTINIEIKQNNKIVQEIKYNPSFWSYIDFKPINYFNTGLQLQEGIESYHNFITADFNFDDLEDFAILYDSGGNGGPVYSYYFQNKKGEFKELKDFPLNEGSFPKEINKKDNTLTISGPIGCCKIETTIFQLKNSKWNIISSKQENMSKN